MSSIKLSVSHENIVTTENVKNKTLVIKAFHKKDGSAVLGADGKMHDDTDLFKGLLKQSIDAFPSFSGKLGETLVIPAGADSDYRNVVVLGLGPKKKVDLKAAKKAGQALFETMKAYKLKDAFLFAERLKTKAFTDQFCAELTSAAIETSYDYDQYKTDPDKDKKLKNLTVVSANLESLTEAHNQAAALSKAKVWAQDLGNMPPNDLYPESYANEIQTELSNLPGVKTKVLTKKDMIELGMGTALAVGGSSPQAPCMVVMEYDGTGGADVAPFGLVGKGVTYDTGGYSLKPAASQRDMKMDMCGSAAVVGAVKALAERRSPVKVAAIVGLVENRITGDAFLVDDVHTAMNGKTVEIGHTDAEGRLVLCDAMTYLQRHHNVHTMVDLATLTGAVVQALGHERAGVFSNSDSLVEKFKTSAERSGENVWHMPIDDVHSKEMEGLIADLTNKGFGGPKCGSSTAAAYLQNFVEGDTKWAHIDIAGTAIGPNHFATGYGVKLLCDVIESNYAVKQKAKKLSATPS